MAHSALFLRAVENNGGAGMAAYNGSSISIMALSLAAACLQTWHDGMATRGSKQAATSHQ